MHHTFRPWPLLAAVFGLLFAGLFFAEMQRDWGNRQTTLPVAVSLESAGCDLPMDSISVVSFDRKGMPLRLTLVRGQWSAVDVFVSGVRIALPRGAVGKVRAVKIAIGLRTLDLPIEAVLESWPRSTPDSEHVAYDSPASLDVPRSRIPILRGLINWPGDATVFSSTLLSCAWKSCLGIFLVGVSLLFIPLKRSQDGGVGGLRVSSTRLALLCLFFAAAYGAAFFVSVPFQETASPRGDAWEYQSMAVNTVAGHGLNRLGTMGPFERYRFYDDPLDSIDHRILSAQWGGRFHAFRTPGYPLFLAGVYSVCGVSPLRAKQAQLFLLVLIAAFLPWLGYRSWGSPGFYGGIAAGLIFLDSWFPLAETLLTETLIAFTAFLVAVFTDFYTRRRTYIRLLMLAVVCGAAPLIKGDLVFIPPLVLLYLAFQAWKKLGPPAHMLVFAAVWICTIAPWSVYASRQAGQLVVLSTQGSEVLPEGNNEGVWKDGGWHPEYRRNPNAFYNRPEIRELPPLEQSVRFFLAFPEKIPLLLWRKLNQGFSTFPYLRLSIILILLRLLQLAHEAGAWGSVGRGRRLRFGPLVTAGAVVLLMGAALALPWDLLFLALCLALVVAGIRGWLRGLQIPASFVILFGNFVLITAVFFGHRRFVSVIDWLFILTGLAYLSSFLFHPFLAGQEGSAGEGSAAFRRSAG